MADMRKTTALGKLVKSKSYARGDFKLLTTTLQGITLHNIPFAKANDGDRGNIPVEGKIYQITNVPIKDDDATDDFDPNDIDRAMYKQHMQAFEVSATKDEIDYVQKTAPKSLIQMLQEFGAILTEPFDFDTGKPPTCQKAPVNLKDAIKRSKSVRGSTSKSLSKHGTTTEKDDGTVEYAGPYIETGGKDGGFNFTAGSKGLIIDKDGNIHNQGKVYNKNAIVEKHSLFGMDTKQNPLVHISPRAIVNPQIDKLPDFNLLNWAIKTFYAFDVVKQIFKIKLKKDNGFQVQIDVNPEFKTQYEEEQLKNNTKGKIV